jgi:hypothetical protein
MKTKRGYTLVDFMIATTLMLTILSILYQLLLSFSAVQMMIHKRTDLTTHLNLTLSDIDIRLANTARLDPGEDVTSLTGLLIYKGFVPLQSAAGFPQCKLQATVGSEIQALRVSFINQYLRPLKTFNPWDENLALPQGSLRLSYQTAASGNFVFADGARNVDEILLIDGENLRSRRYRVSSVGPVLGSGNDPYDLVVRPPGGFNYTVLTVSQPLTLSGIPKPKDSVLMVSGSIVYGLATEVICATDQNEIVSINDNGLTQKTNIIFTAPKGTDITRFKFSYYATKKNVTIDPAAFFDFPWTDPTKQICINVVRLEIEFKDLSSGKYQKFERLFMLRNFNDARPVVCQT